MQQRMPEKKSRPLSVLSPFGLGQTKPHHFRDMLGVMWKNRDNLPYAWKILSQGVCDGCALGVAGFYDWTMDGVHLCMTRLNLLRLNTAPAFDPDILSDVTRLQHKTNAELRELGRIPYPMLRRRGERGFARIPWDEALALIARRINAAQDPDRLAFYLTSRGLTNETYYVAQKAARLLGTNNIDNAARLCHSPSTGAMKTAIGYGATTCSYKDWYGTDLIIFFGANPANDQPVTMKYLDAAKQLGTKVALVNPYFEPGMKRYWVPSVTRSALFGTDITDHWFGVRQGGDVAFIYGVLKILFENNWHDENFCRNYATGFEALRQAALAMDFDELERASGLGRDRMRELAGLIRDARSAVLVWSMGITQHAFGADAVQMVLNLGLSKGFVGRDKCGLMPIRGHSGVQGGAEMGAYATVFPGGKAINADNAAGLSAKYRFAVPDRPGLSAAEMVEASARGELDLLYCVGGNFVRTLPDPSYVRQAMSRVPLRVHQDIILTDQMFIEGDEVLILPAQTRYEQDGGGTETTTERRVCFSPQIPRQVGEARAEWRILRDVALAARPEMAGAFGCDSGQAIRQEIAQVIPTYDGIQHLRKTGDAFQYIGEHLCADWKFNTPDGKAHFRAPPLQHRAPDRATGQFHVSTRRGKQFNTLIYAEVDPITGAARDAIFMSPDDAADLHLRSGDRIRLTSDAGQCDGRVFLAPIARGNLQVHWPEGNVLIPGGLRDALGGVPDYNAYARVEPIGRRQAKEQPA